MGRSVVMLVDGMNIAYRSFYAMPRLRNANRQEVGAVLGFCNALQRHVFDRVSHAVVVWDPSGATHRHTTYENYKANRPPMDPDMSSQLPIFKDACDAFGIAQVSVPKYEADDVIASLTRMFFVSEFDSEVRILSKDKDLVQLLRSNLPLSLQDPSSGDLLDYDAATKKFGVNPELLGDVLSLAGDAADNIPGVPGIGMKTAAKLVSSYGSVHEMYENIESVSGPKRRSKLECSKDVVALSKTLVSLVDDIPSEIVRKHFDIPTGTLSSRNRAGDFLSRAAEIADPRTRMDKIEAFCDANCLWDLKKRSSRRWGEGGGGS